MHVVWKLRNRCAGSNTSWILFIAPAKTNAIVGNLIRKVLLEQSKGVRTGARRNAKSRAQYRVCTWSVYFMGNTTLSCLNCENMR